MSNISAILLGAGESKRMGQNKLLLPLKKWSIFEHCLRTLLRSRVKEIIVVVNDRGMERVRHLKDRRVRVAVNPQYKRGMSTSIRCGLKLLNPKSSGILIALGDQPFIKTRTINALIGAFGKSEGEIIIPSFRGKRGHPVIFPRKYERELFRLKGDAGGKSILKRHPEEVRVISVRSEGVIKDIDTLDDYRRELRMKR